MFKCQQEPFLETLETIITNATPVESGDNVDSICKNNGIASFAPGEKLYEVTLQDTILFPEGGGQPDDRGTINGFPVLRVIRSGSLALHFIKLELADVDKFEVGSKAEVRLDWKRRFDHMQQHSGQHLITALADSMYGFPTTSWWLGSQVSYIELGTTAISDEQMKTLEEAVNSKIRQGISVSVDVVGLDSPKLKTARCKGLPEDVQGHVRIISIDGIDDNVCCGTHVTSLSQLQMIKLLYAEKKKGKLLLYFLAGDRLLSKMEEHFQREQKLVGVLKSSSLELVDAAEKVCLGLKQSMKSCTLLGKDLAAIEAKQFRAQNPGLLYYYTREEVNLEFGMSLLRELGETNDHVIVIVLKTDGNTGHLLLRGGSSVISSALTLTLGDELCKILEGKGTLRGNLYQGKIAKFKCHSKALKFANNFVENFLKST